MKKVLFVVPFLPYPLGSGGHQAIYNGLVAAAESAELYLTYPNYENDAEDRKALAEKLDGRIRILPFQVSVNRKGDKLLNYIYRLKFTLKKLIKGEAATRKEPSPYEQWLEQILPKANAYCSYVNDLVEQYHIDIVQCEMLETLAFGLTLPNTVKKYFVHHELGFVRKGQHPIVMKEPLTATAHLTINQLVEVNLLNRFDTVITLSETDTHKLRDAGVTCPLHTSFATVNHMPSTNLESTSGMLLSFVGPEWHPSNKQGLKWFLDSCWESLLAANADYRLQIIGKWTDETCHEWTIRYRSISFLGFVEDLASTIKNTIMIVPITIGSGIRMKILEAGLIGVPIVTTSVGVEGLPLTNGESCFIGDSPEEFIRGIQALSDQSIRERFIHSAQKIITDRYSQRALNDNRAVLYQ